jgi:hypothetical protein
VPPGGPAFRVGPAAFQLKRGRLRFARASAYIPAMSDLDYWRAKLREPEAELEAARKRTEVDAAAAKLQRAKAELKALEAKADRPKRRASLGSRSGRA